MIVNNMEKTVHAVGTDSICPNCDEPLKSFWRERENKKKEKYKTRNCHFTVNHLIKCNPVAFRFFKKLLSLHFFVCYKLNNTCL